VNLALTLFQYKPTCPFDTTNMLTLLITAAPVTGQGSGQIISADMGTSVVMQGTGSQTILSK
jgi:hypothetical protein